MKLNYRRTFYIGLAFLSISAFWQLYDNIIPLILKNTFNIGDTLAGTVMALDNVLALILLPFFGALSDRVSTKIGKRMPFILIGTAIAVIAMLLMPFGDNQANFPLFIAALFIALLALSIYRSPAVALMPDLTPKPLRSKANAVINLMGAAGAVLALIAIRLLIPEQGIPNYFPLFTIIAGVMIVAVIVLYYKIKENDLLATMPKEKMDEEKSQAQATDSQDLPKEVKRSLVFLLLSVSFWFMAYNAVITAFSKYAQEVLGIAGGGFATTLLIATVAAIFAFIPVASLATDHGRKRTILSGIVLMFVAFSIAAFFTTDHWAINVLLVMVGLGWAAINVNSYPMVVEMAKGSDIGKFTGYYYTFSMAGQILTPILSGALMEYVGYRTLFPYAAVFMVIAFITMSNVKHGDSKPITPKDKLELLDVAD